MLKNKPSKIPVYQQHTNFDSLVDGYCRNNYESKQHIAVQLTKIILLFIDQMNGYTFRWNVNLEDTCEKTLESDPFDLELCNQFFLRAKKRSSSLSTTLNLMSFPFPNKFGSIMIHVQFYCDQVDEVYSKIHEINADSDDINDSFQTSHVHWKINHGNKVKKLTIECKLNVLRIAAPSVKNPSYSVPKPKNNILYNNQITDYKDETLRFSWNVQQKKLISKIPVQNNISIISNVFHNIFQILIWNVTNYSAFESANNGIQISGAYFGVRIVGLPQSTNKMAVKLQIEAEIGDNKTAICCRMCTFSYDECLYRLSPEKEAILSKQLLKKHKLKLFCKANILARYGNQNNYISVKPPQINNKSIGKANQQSMNSFPINKATKTEILNSKSKIIHCVSQSFIWHITDAIILNKIKSQPSNNCMINGPIFELFEHQWYISVEHDDTNTWSYSPTQMTSSKHNKKIRIRIHSFGLGAKESMDCKILMCVLQTGAKAEYYQSFCAQLSQFPSHSHHSNTFLECDGLSLSLLNEISIKIAVSVVNYKTNCMNTIKDSKAQNESGKELNKEVKLWLCDSVGLEEYCHLFLCHSIENMEIVKQLSKDDMYRMGIKKVGHQIRLTYHIKLLRNHDASREGNTNNRKRKYEHIYDKDNGHQINDTPPNKKQKTEHL